MGSPGSRGGGNAWSDSTELGVGHQGNEKRLPGSGMGVKPENLGGHIGGGCFLFPFEQMKRSLRAFSTSCPHHALLCIEQDAGS